MPCESEGVHAEASLLKVTVEDLEVTVPHAGQRHMNELRLFNSCCQVKTLGKDARMHKQGGDEARAMILETHVRDIRAGAIVHSGGPNCR